MTIKPELTLEEHVSAFLNTGLSDYLLRYCFLAGRLSMLTHKDGDSAFEEYKAQRFKPEKVKESATTER